MKILCALLLSTALFAGTSRARQARDARTPSSPAEVIAALELRRFKAMTEGDLVALDRLLGEHLTYTHATGWTHNKREFLESLRTGKLRYLSIDPANAKARTHGTTAAGTGRAVFKVCLDGKEFGLQIRFLGVHVRRHGRWQLVAWQSPRLAS